MFENDNMIVKKIRFKDDKDKNEFNVAASEMAELNICLKYGNTMIDGKSTLGMMLLPDQEDIEMTVSFDDDMLQDVEKLFKRWIVE